MKAKFSIEKDHTVIMQTKTLKKAKQFVDDHLAGKEKEGIGIYSEDAGKYTWKVWKGIWVRI